MNGLMKNKLSLLALMASPLLLAACGDSGGGVGAGGSANLFADMAGAGAALESEFALVQFTRIDDMPATGSANFSGVAAYTESDDIGAISEIEYTSADLVSDVTLTADFAAETVGGGLSNFQSNSAAYDGIEADLALTGGTFAGLDSEYQTFTSDIEGEMTSATRNGSVDGFMTGYFVDRNVLGATGAVSLEVLNGDDPTALMGTFIAGRD